MPEVGVQNLTLGYNRHPAIHHLSGAFAGGSLTAVIGPNGAGKSTLLKGLAGGLKPLEGGVDLGRFKRCDIGFLPQKTNVDTDFPIGVLDTVCMGLWPRVGLFGGIGVDKLDEARAALATVGLEGFEERPIGSLSRGQFQRVLFARLWVQQASVVLLDEPFTALDERTQQDLELVIEQWHRDGRIVIAVVHDIAQVRRFFPDTLILAREAIAWGPTAETATDENLGKARMVAEAWDDDALVYARDAAA